MRCDNLSPPPASLPPHQIVADAELVQKAFAVWKGEVPPDTAEVPAGSDVARAAAAVAERYEAAARGRAASTAGAIAGGIAAGGSGGGDGGGDGGPTAGEDEGTSAAEGGAGAKAAAARSGTAASAAAAAAAAAAPPSPDPAVATAVAADGVAAPAVAAAGRLRGPSLLSALLRRGALPRTRSGGGGGGGGGQHAGPDGASVASGVSGGAAFAMAAGAELSELTRPPASALEAAILSEMEAAAAAAGTAQRRRQQQQQQQQQRGWWQQRAPQQQQQLQRQSSDPSADADAPWAMPARDRDDDQSAGAAVAAAAVLASASAASSAASVGVPSVRVRRRLLQTSAPRFLSPGAFELTPCRLVATSIGDFKFKGTGAVAMAAVAPAELRARPFPAGQPGGKGLCVRPGDGRVLAEADVPLPDLAAQLRADFEARAAAAAALTPAVSFRAAATAAAAAAAVRAAGGGGAPAARSRWEALSGSAGMQRLGSLLSRGRGNFSGGSADDSEEGSSVSAGDVLSPLGGSASAAFANTGARGPPVRRSVSATARLGRADAAALSALRARALLSSEEGNGEPQPARRASVGDSSGGATGAP